MRFRPFETARAAIAGTLGAVFLAFTAPAAATIPAEPAEILASALKAHGGDVFVDPETLQLQGTAVFYDPATGTIRSIADDYRMWREFERGRTNSHGAHGKVRIIAKSGDKTLFEVGYDGQITWTQNGIMPKAQAGAYWASNFGFGIIRSALDDGFEHTFLPPRMINGRGTSLIRITDPDGQQTIFGLDAESLFIRYMAFDSPRGFHERIYDDFIRLPQNGWVQARSVTLLYDGVVNNTVFWDTVSIGEGIDQAVFAPPQENQE